MFNWLLAEGEIECRGRDLISHRDTAIIRLIWDTGARLSEIAALNVGEADLDTDVIHVLGKGRRPRAVPIGDRHRGVQAATAPRRQHPDRASVASGGRPAPGFEGSTWSRPHSRLDNEIAADQQVRYVSATTRW